MARRKNPDAAPDFLRQYFETGAEPDVRKAPDEWLDIVSMLPGRMLTAWEAARKDIMPAWVRQHPCTRPFAWWAYDAPQKCEREKFVHGGQLYYEAQAVYLKRHGVLTDGEKRHLAKNEELLEPVPHYRRYKK